VRFVVLSFLTTEQNNQRTWLASSLLGTALARLRTSVSTPLSFESNDLWPWSFAYVWVTTMARRRLKLKVTGQGQDSVGLISILDRGEFSSWRYNRPGPAACCATSAIVCKISSQWWRDRRDAHLLHCFYLFAVCHHLSDDTHRLYNGSSTAINTCWRHAIQVWIVPSAAAAAAQVIGLLRAGKWAKQVTLRLLSPTRMRTLKKICHSLDRNALVSVSCLLFNAVVNDW